MDFIVAVILGIVQGITEWLPVSSSGHLVIFQRFFQLEPPLFFDVMLHAGTLLAVVLFLRKEIAEIFSSLIKLDFSSESGKMIPLLTIGTIPAVAAGLLFRNIFESMFSSVKFVSIALFITGIFLLLSQRKSGKKNPGKTDAVVIGLAQAFSIAPGISRSGMTISAALLRGVEKEKAARFSFLLSIPLILGALFIELDNIIVSDIGAVLLGTLTAFIVGYISLNGLMKILIKRKFHYFAVYCFVIGLILMIL